MTDNPKTTAHQDKPTAQIYGFARTRAFPEFLAAIKAPGGHVPSDSAEVVDIPCPEETEAQESAPPTTVELVHVPRGEHGPGDSAAIVSCAPQAQSRAARGTKKRTRRKTIRKTPRLSPRQLHEAHCGICRSKLRDEIDEEFVHWHYVGDIAKEYQIERRAIYRHAHATGLFAIRACNIRDALGHVIHFAENADVTGDTIVRAVRTFAHINAAGEWAPPPTHFIITNRGTVQAENRGGPARKSIDTPSQVKESLRP